MDTLIQVAAACGPVALAIMGVVVSLNPPDRMGRTHKMWASSFVAVGIVAALAIFSELRGTDQILGQIWEHLKESKSPASAKEGARFVLSMSPINRETKIVTVTAINKGDVIARGGTSGAFQLALSDHILTEQQEDEWYAKAVAILPPLGTGIDFLKDNGRTMPFEVPATEAQFNDVIAGKSFIYVFFVMNFKDETTPTGKMFRASACSRFQFKLDEPRVCFGHNESRQLN